MPPRFITFEGLDGSGKTTHLRRISAELRDRAVPHLVTHEPGGSPLGEAVRKIFLDPGWGAIDGGVEMLLVFASRRQHLLEVIDPALEAGEHVLCDRFTDSTRAYQGAGRGIDRGVIDRIDSVATGGRVPDRTLLFDLPPEMARRRGAAPGRRETHLEDCRLDVEDLGFYERVRDGFLALARGEPERFRVIDSSGEKEETGRQVREALADLLPLGQASDGRAAEGSKHGAGR